MGGGARRACWATSGQQDHGITAGLWQVLSAAVCPCSPTSQLVTHARLAPTSNLACSRFLQGPDTDRAEVEKLKAAITNCEQHQPLAATC